MTQAEGTRNGTFGLRHFIFFVRAKNMYFYTLFFS